MKESLLSSFIKYLKSFIHGVKEEDKKIKNTSHVAKTLPRNKFRRESKLDLHRGEIIKALDNGESKVSIARRLNTSQVNLYHWMKKRGIKISKKR
jgi:transcriptional regulator with GAF, ATPase, and Fis domain